MEAGTQKTMPVMVEEFDLCWGMGYNSFVLFFLKKQNLPQIHLGLYETVKYRHWFIELCLCDVQ